MHVSELYAVMCACVGVVMYLASMVEKGYGTVKIKRSELMIYALLVMLIIWGGISNIKNLGGLLDDRLMHIRYIELLLLCILMRPMMSGLKLNEYLLSITAAALVNAVYVLADWLVLGTYVERPGDVLLGGAATLMIGLGLAVELAGLVYKEKVRWVSYVLIAIFIATILMNGTKTWLLSSVVSVIVVIIMVRRIDVKRIFKVYGWAMILSMIIIGLVISLGIRGIVENIFVNRAGEILLLLEGGVEGTTLGSRLFKWDYAVYMIKENPILGVGFGNIDLMLYSWLSDAARAKADNQYLDMALTMGIPGVAVFILFLLIMIREMMNISLRYIDQRYVFIMLMYLVISYMLWASLYGYQILINAYIYSYILIAMARHGKSIVTVKSDA